ncbi:MAG: DMT family transporter [Acidobacteriota bacterium]
MALVSFSLNSILCRMALGPRSVDAATFTTVRLVSGAATLWLLAAAAGRRNPWRDGTWAGAAALFSYAIAFSYAYRRLPAGTGALILFASVQITMIGWGLLRGERPRSIEWAGFVIALAGSVVLTRPGLAAPPAVAAALGDRRSLVGHLLAPRS